MAIKKNDRRRSAANSARAPTAIRPSPPAAVNTGARAAVNVSALADLTRARTPLALDPIGSAAATANQDFTLARTTAAANLYAGIQQVHSSLTTLLGVMSAPTTPAQLVSTLVQPDGTPGAQLQVQFDPASLGSTAPVVTVVTSDVGMFQMALPPGVPLPANGAIPLSVHGATVTVSVSVAATHIAANGLAPAIALPQFVAPLQPSIVASLLAIVSSASPPNQLPTPTNPPQLAAVSLGDCANCQLKYGANTAVDRFPFGVFHRLVEPRASILSQAVRTSVANNYTFLPLYSGAAQAPQIAANQQVAYVDRIPIEQPISVDGFRDQLMGLQPNGTLTADELRPMAGTLGLGYTLWLAQRWTFKGLALGDLVYSLPLAPGEQQQVAIFERTDTQSVFESESFTEEQQIEQSAVADTSTNATFNSAFSEVANGSSSFHTDSSSSSWGGSLILISGGSGSSSASGTSASSLEGQRNTTQQAAESTHSAAENQAAARRSAARTGMRLATATESEQVTTKTITNHNHTRALTMQYWEVQRLYDVTTTIEGLTMTVLVPLQVVRFMPAGQPLAISDPALLSTRAQVVARYGSLVRHGDILLQALPKKYLRGLELLLEFLSDPTAQVDTANASAEDVVNFTLTGSFLYCETVVITVVTSRNTRIGPVYLTMTPRNVPPADTFSTREEFVSYLVNVRQTGAATLTGAIALPPSVSRSDVVGFEITRSFGTASYTLVTPAMLGLSYLQGKFGAAAPADWANQAVQSTFGNANAQRQTVTLSAADLENLVGPPTLTSFVAQVSDGGGAAAPEQYTQVSVAGVQLPIMPYPVSAAHVPPILKYQQLLEIEKMASHVVRRTLTYSRAVWASMSPEERAIMLEAYTIGVPAGGVADATQMIPLLNCVENRVLGFLGNSMMLPFIIPEALAGAGIADGAARLSPLAIQEALLAFQQNGFQSPASTVALPTRGVLGEAVLGSCPSAEKIDLSRFWNWQDSPSDTAPAISPVTLPTTTPSLTAGVTAPNSLTQLPSLINNVLTAPTPDTTLLQALGKDAASQQDFSTSLTGATQLAGLLTNAQNVANSARADALKTTKDLTSQAIATVGNLVGGSMQNSNPNAGSSALAAQTGANVGGTQGSKGGAGPGTTANQGGTSSGKGGAGPGGAPGTGTGTGSGAGPGGGPATGAGSGGGGGGGVADLGGGDILGGALDGGAGGLGGGALDAGSAADLAVLFAQAPPVPQYQQQQALSAPRRLPASQPPPPKRGGATGFFEANEEI